MRNFFAGIGEILAGVLGWIVGVVIILAVLGLLVSFGLVVLGVIAVLVVIGLIIGAVRKVFGIKPKPKVEVKKRKSWEAGEPYYS